MTTPMDQQILDWLKSELSKINTASGYRNTLQANRILAEDKQEPDDGQPYVFLEDTQETDVNTHRDRRDATLTVAIDFRIPVSTSEEPRAKARLFLADMRQALSAYADLNYLREHTPKGVKSFEYGDRVIGRREDGSNWIDAIQEVAIRFTEPHDTQ